MGLIRGLTDLAAPPGCHACGALVYKPICDECLVSIERVEEPVCPVCGRPTVHDVDVCRYCRADRPKFDKARALAVYDFPVREAIRALKRKQGRGIARQLAPLVYEAFADEIGAADMITFVPVTPARRVKRGHNQAQELAIALSALAGMSVAGTLRVARAMKKQGTRKMAERKPNVKQVFALRNRSRRLTNLISGCHLILVDDVVTTGATVSECARVLKEAGAARVTVIALARAIQDYNPSPDRKKQA